jgi:hypothetical protein
VTKLGVGELLGYKDLLSSPYVAGHFGCAEELGVVGVLAVSGSCAVPLPILLDSHKMAKVVPSLALSCFDKITTPA